MSLDCFNDSEIGASMNPTQPSLVVTVKLLFFSEPSPLEANPCLQSKQIFDAGPLYFLGLEIA